MNPGTVPRLDMTQQMAVGLSCGSRTAWRLGGVRIGPGDRGVCGGEICKPGCAHCTGSCSSHRLGACPLHWLLSKPRTLFGMSLMLRSVPVSSGSLIFLQLSALLYSFMSAHSPQELLEDPDSCHSFLNLLHAFPPEVNRSHNALLVFPFIKILSLDYS